MTDDDFRKLCNVYGFAPSRALRELIDNATAVAEAELERCRKACAATAEAWRAAAQLATQRDALLGALRPFAAINASVGFTQRDVERARAAIKAAEEPA